MTSAAGTSAALPRAAKRASVKPPGKPEPPVIAQLGTSFLEIATVVGGMGILAGKIAARVVTLRVDGAELLRNLYKMGVKSIPIVIVTALFTGAIMVIQAAPIV